MGMVATFLRSVFFFFGLKSTLLARRNIRNAHRWRSSNKEAQKRLVESNGTPAMDQVSHPLRFPMKLHQDT